MQHFTKIICFQETLKTIGLNDYLNLPNIVLIGNSLAGKSTLLEQILEIELVPKGKCIVTRRPLILRLSNISNNSCPQMTAEFVEELKGQKFTDFKEVSANIAKLNEKMFIQSISEIPIILAIQGPSYPDITIIDLQGISKGQYSNVTEVSTNMARRYCQDNSTIILCVVPAFEDTLTSDAVLLAKHFDPDGDRTICVLTKIDMLDQGTNFIKKLREEKILWQYGQVYVKLRSLKDIQENTSILQAVEKEMCFFSNHPIYSTIPGEFFGISALTKKITQILYSRIRSLLPQLVREINQKVKSLSIRLENLGPELPIQEEVLIKFIQAKFKYIFQLIDTFCARFKMSITGSYDQIQCFKSSPIITTRRSIEVLFQQIYNEFTDQDYQPLKKFKDEDILQIIQRYQGQTIHGFIPVDAFYALLNPELHKLLAPAQTAVEQVYTILEESAIAILHTQLFRLPTVQQTLQTQILQILSICKKNAHDSVQDAIEAEMNYIFTNDLDYLSGSQFTKFQYEKRNNLLKGNSIVAELKSKVEHFFQLIVRGVRDNIPKLIGHFLVKGCQAKMLLQLQQNLIQNQSILSILIEDEKVVVERNALNQEIQKCRLAKKVIQMDPHLSQYILQQAEAQYQKELQKKQSDQQQYQLSEKQKLEKLQILIELENEMIEEKQKNEQRKRLVEIEKERVQEKQNQEKQQYSLQEKLLEKQHQEEIFQLRLQEKQNQVKQQQILQEKLPEKQHQQQIFQLQKQQQQDEQLKVANNNKKLEILEDIIKKAKNNQNDSKYFSNYQIIKYEQQQLKILKEEKKNLPILSIQHMKQSITSGNIEVLFYVLADNLRRQNRELLITEKQQNMGLTSLLCADSNDQKCYKFESDEINFVEMNNNEQTKSQFIYKFKEQISQTIDIPITDIEILDIQQDKNIVLFTIKSEKQLGDAELLVLKNVCNGNIDVYNYFACGQDVILGNKVGLSPQDFNPQYNMTWSYKHKVKELRGPPYHIYEYFFPIGYSGFALNVDKFGPNKNWIKMDGNYEEWRILYHSTYQEAMKPIVKEGLKPGPRQLHKNSICELTNELVGKGVYFCNQITTCEKKYGHPTIINDKKFILVFQSRVSPLAIRQSERMKQKGYFVVNETKDIRPYRILLKELK